MAKAKELHEQDPSVTIPKVEVVGTWAVQTKLCVCVCVCVRERGHSILPLPPTVHVGLAIHLHLCCRVACKRPGSGTFVLICCPGCVLAGSRQRGCAMVCVCVCVCVYVQRRYCQLGGRQRQTHKDEHTIVS